MKVGSEFDTLTVLLAGRTLRYPLKRRLDGPRRRCERFGEVKNHLLLPRLEHHIAENCAFLGHYAASSDSSYRRFEATICLKRNGTGRLSRNVVKKLPLLAA